jgi:uncharacterized spore protein YtfJ
MRLPVRRADDPGKEVHMDVQELIGEARDAMTARRVYGDPIERDGTAVIPAAVVRGGAGGGEGKSEAGEGSGSGFGLMAHPAGAWVVTGERVEWKPAVDVNRLVLGFQVVAVAATLTFGLIALARLRAKNA